MRRRRSRGSHTSNGAAFWSGVRHRRGRDDGEERLALFLFPFQVKKIARANRLAGKAAARGGNRGNATACRLHAPRPYPQEVLPAVA